MLLRDASGVVTVSSALTPLDEMRWEVVRLKLARAFQKSPLTMLRKLNEVEADRVVRTLSDPVPSTVLLR